ncbi:MAG: nucleoside triphosphate pyrophosphohydrolase [Agarilytica sp.]
MSDAKYQLENLIYLMQRLREPESGCPWDLKQSYLSITPSTIEEAYEVVDAIEHEDFDHLREELGDLLFQVIFYCQLADEEKRFNIHDVVHALTAKLVRRHPHVFPAGTLESRRSSGEVLDEKQIKTSWENIKQSERQSKGKAGVFDDVPISLPGLTRAAKLQKRAAKFGFDWQHRDDVLNKIEEEFTELCEAFEAKNESDIEEELADLMFSCVNLARHLGRDPDSLMRQANKKFEQRFSHVVERMEQKQGNIGQEKFSVEELEAFWEESKR